MKNVEIKVIEGSIKEAYFIDKIAINCKHKVLQLKGTEFNEYTFDGRPINSYIVNIKDRIRLNGKFRILNRF